MAQYALYRYYTPRCLPDGEAGSATPTLRGHQGYTFSTAGDDTTAYLGEISGDRRVNVGDHGSRQGLHLVHQPLFVLQLRDMHTWQHGTCHVGPDTWKAVRTAQTASPGLGCPVVDGRVAADMRQRSSRHVWPPGLTWRSQKVANLCTEALRLSTGEHTRVHAAHAPKHVAIWACPPATRGKGQLQLDGGHYFFATGRMSRWCAA